MDSIKTLIDHTYKNLAASLFVEHYNGNPPTRKAIKKLYFDISTGVSDYGIDDSSKILYIMLDEIDRMIYSEAPKIEKSYVDYYEGTNAVEFKINIGQLIKDHIDGKGLIDAIQSELFAQNGYIRVAELFYYKKNHRYYDGRLEKVYREIVDSIVSDDVDNIIAIDTSEEVHGLTQQIISSAAEDVYNNLYGNKAVPSKYKPTSKKYLRWINEDTPLYAITTYKGYPEKLFTKEYYDTVKADIKKSQFLPITKVNKRLVLEPSTYYPNGIEALSAKAQAESLVTRMLPLAGIHISVFGMKVDEYIPIIPKTMVNDFNKCFAGIFRLFAEKKTIKEILPDGRVKRGDKIHFESRLELINKPEDFIIVDDAIKVVTTVAIINCWDVNVYINSQTNTANINVGKSNNISEIEFIHSAAKLLR